MQLVVQHGKNCDGGGVGAEDERAEGDRGCAELCHVFVFGGGEITFGADPDNSALRTVILRGEKI